jgi:methylated-DNA-[protein]-cysteine S-methyltransferase
MCAMTASTATASILTPIGLVSLTEESGELVAVRIDPTGTRAHHSPGNGALDEAVTQMTAYFVGERLDFDLKLRALPSPEGQALRKGIASVPYGETLTYGALAQKLDSAPRAVGQACKRNAFPIIIPCHRVTSASGPENYSGGAGVATKAWLLDFEQATLPPDKRTRLL